MLICSQDLALMPAFRYTTVCKEFTIHQFSRDPKIQSPVADATRLFFAERGGFEPPVPDKEYAGLANRWFQPLTHLSNIALSEG